MKGLFWVLATLTVLIYSIGWWSIIVFGAVIILIVAFIENNKKSEGELQESTLERPQSVKTYNNVSDGGDETEKIVFNITHNNNSVASDAFDWKLKQKIKHEGLISAVAFVKARTGYDLVSSKKYVEKYIEDNSIKLKA